MSDPRGCYYLVSVLADEDKKKICPDVQTCTVTPVGYYQSEAMRDLDVRMYFCSEHLHRMEEWAILNATLTGQKFTIRLIPELERFYQNSRKYL